MADGAGGKRDGAGTERRACTLGTTLVSAGRGLLEDLDRNWAVVIKVLTILPTHAGSWPCLGLQLSSALTCLVEILLADDMTLKATLSLCK